MVVLSMAAKYMSTAMSYTDTGGNVVREMSWGAPSGLQGTVLIWLSAATADTSNTIFGVNEAAPPSLK